MAAPSKTKRVKRWIVGILAATVLIGAGWFFAGKPFASPYLSDVSSITAQLYNRPDGGADIAKFEIPKHSQEAILASLNGSQQDNNPPKWQVLGNIEINLKTGSIHVNLFWTGEELGAFRADGKYYRGASDSEFIRSIEAAKQDKGEQGGGGNSASLRASP